MPKRSLRHPLEWPAYIVAVALIPLVLAFGYWWDGEYMLYFIGPFTVVIILLREIDRRLAHGNSVQLSRSQFPDIYAKVDDYSNTLGLKRVPDVYVTTGGGVLNALSSESWGKSYIVLNSELFSDQGDSIKDGLAYIIGHELAHIKLKHTSIFYNLPLVPWMWLSMIPYLGLVFGLPFNVLSRFREYSCDRVGAYLAPNGVNGLLLLAAGRYVYENVDLESFLTQSESRETRGRWMGIAELFSTHTFVANRVRNLYKLGLFTRSHLDGRAQAGAG